GQPGPPADLPVAWVRLGGLSKFELDAERGLQESLKAVEVARAAGADFERVWAASWVAFGLIDVGRREEGMRMLDDTFDEARRRGWTFIAHNIAYNDAWTRTHTMVPGIDDRLQALAAEPRPPAVRGTGGR